MTNDLNRPLNPTYMRMDVLRSLDVVTIHSLAQSSTGTVTAYKLVLGRCLLAMDESKGYLEYGCSNTVSYATNRLGIPGREARTCRRVAQRLLALPLLTLEAEQGQIDWCKLREISRKASPETEELWVELARKHNYEAIELLVGKTPRGALPGDVDTEGESYLSEFRCRLSPEIFQMLAQARRLYSAELGEVVTNAVVLEWVLTSYISQQPLDREALEKVRREADKDLQAERAREIPAVMEARELAAELGILADEASRVGQDVESEIEKQASQNAEMSRVGQDERDIEEQASQNDEMSRVGQDVESEIAEQASQNAEMSRVGQDGEVEVQAIQNDEMSRAGQHHEGDVEASRDSEMSRVGENGERDIEMQASQNDEMSRAGQERGCEIGPQASQNAEISSVGQDVEGDIEELASQNSELPRVSQFPHADLGADLGTDPDLETLLAQAIGGPTCWQNHLLRFNPDSRLPTKAQRKEILRRDGYRCRTPGCQNRAWFHIHHVTHYADGGKTVAGNLLCLCSGCHRNHHNGYLKIQVENGELIFRDRKGRRLDREAHIELASWIDFRLGWGGEEDDCYRRRYQTGDWGVSSYSPDVMSVRTE